MEKLQIATQRFQTAIRKRFSIRLALLGAIVLVLVASWVIPAEWARVIGIFLPAIILGGVIGWLTFSRKQWIGWTAILAACTMLLWYGRVSQPTKKKLGLAIPQAPFLATVILTNLFRATVFLTNLMHRLRCPISNR